MPDRAIYPLPDTAPFPVSIARLYLLADLFLEGTHRSPTATRWYTETVHSLGGFPKVVGLWSQQPGLPSRLATAISTIIHVSAAPQSVSVASYVDITTHTEPTVHELVATTTDLLYGDGDLEAAEVLLARLTVHP